MPSKETILVVDDEFGPRESLRIVLKSQYQIHTAASINEALRFIRENHVDLVLLDLNMPGGSGFDVLKAIRDSGLDIQVIVITGYGSLGNAKEAICLGAEDFIQKPYDVAAVLLIVRRVLEKRRKKLEIETSAEQMKTLRSPAS